MLPSCGYFRTVICPFYSNGLCERPHCHFRHGQPQTPAGLIGSKLNLPLPLDDVSGDLSTKEELLQHLQKAIQKVQEDMKRNEEELAGMRSASQTHSSDSAGPVTYIPTPVSKSTAVKTTNSEVIMTNSAIPEYRPTPISKLKKMQKGIGGDGEKSRDTKEYDPLDSFKIPEVVPKVKRKRTEEYDPTLVKCRPTYSVSLDDDSDDDSFAVQKKVKLSDDDDNNQKDNVASSDSANFSDDDDDDCLTADASKVETEKKNNLEKVDTNSADEMPMNEFDIVKHILIESKQSEEKLKGTSKDSNKAKEIGEKAKDIAKKPKESSSTSQKTISHQNKDKNKVSSSSDSKKEKSSKNSSSSSHSKESPKKKETSSKDSKQLKEHSKKDSRSSSSEKSSDSSSSHKKSSSSVSSSKESSKTKHVHSSDKDKSHKTDKSKQKDVSKDHKSESKPKDKSKESHSSSKHSSSKSSSSSSSKSSKSDKPSTSKTSKSTNSAASPKASNHESKTKKSSDKKTDSKSWTNALGSEQFKVPSSPMKNNSPSKLFVYSNKASDNSVVESTSDEDDDDRSDYNSLSFDLDDLDTDLDEHDTYEECLRIFNESSSSVPNNNEDVEESLKVLPKSVAKPPVEVPVIQSKKRVAYQGSESVKRPTPISRVSQVQLINSRLQRVQEVYDKQKETILKKSPTPNPFNNSVMGKKRIAHVPNAALIAAAAQRAKMNRTAATTSSMNSFQAAASMSNATPTIASTVTKGEKRVAHVPNVSNRPTILAEYGSKVPTNVRQRYLNLFVDECLKFYPEEEDAFERAIAEEKNVYERSSNKTVYLNVAVNAIKRIRNEADTSQVSFADTVKPSTSRQKTESNVRPQPMRISHEYILAGPKAANIGIKIDRQRNMRKEAELSGAQLYKMLKPYILTREQLEEHGFPMPHPTEPGKAIINTPEGKKPSPTDPLNRVCSRCGKKYRVTLKGLYVVKEECVYHWGKPWKRRIAGSLETRYSCCQGDQESDGCCVGMGHVFEGNECDVSRGFVKTLPKTPPLDGNYGVFALDCEMCYTTNGVELTRVTVINHNLKPVFESLVKPENPILDYNTRFSGINEEDLLRVKTSIRDVQAVLLSLFNDKTIILGHSLESDFKALKLIHPTVVDTSIVFPHKRGLPYKRALKTLMAEYLNKIIQNNVEGHDSQEDAVACMELMLWKIREDMKRINR